MKNKTNIDWDLMIAQHKESRMTIGDFCKSKDISINAFKYHLYHRKDYQNEDSVLPDEEFSLVPVQIKKHNHDVDSFIDIRLPSNASIRVDHSTDLSLLKKVMEAIL